MKLLTARHHKLFEYWRSLLQGDRDFPTRGQFDPIDVPTVLSNLMLLDREGDDWRIKVAGTEVVKATGADYTGLLLSDALHGKYHDSIREIIEKCCEIRAPLASQSKFQWDKGRALETTRLMLPLGFDAQPDTVGHILVAQTYQYDRTGPDSSILLDVTDDDFVEISHQLISVES